MFKRFFFKIYVRIFWIIRVFLTFLGLKRKYLIDNVSVRIDFTHRLPDYQKDHPKYDKFLPFFSKFLPSNTIVVDVGSNIGDTVVAMSQKNTNLEYICIEADKNYYNDLLQNIKALKRHFPNVKIHTYNKFVGKFLDNVSLKKGTEGTNTAVEGGEIRSETLSEILINTKINKKISLLKTDVDGYDYDVIYSSYPCLSKDTYLFFECLYENVNQYENFKIFFKDLIINKYDTFAVFDNFGQFICFSNNLQQMYQLLEYVLFQNQGKTTRTFFYYDVLAFNSSLKENVKRIITQYNNL